MGQKLWAVAFWLALWARHSDGQDNICLKNFRALDPEPSSVSLRWEYTCRVARFSGKPITKVLYKVLLKCAFGISNKFKVVQCLLLTFLKVYYHHLDWKACAGSSNVDPNRGTGSGHQEVIDDNSMTIAGLNPFSDYKYVLLHHFHVMVTGKSQ